MIDKSTHFTFRYVWAVLIAAGLNGCADTGGAYGPYSARRAPVYDRHPNDYPSDTTGRSAQSYPQPQRTDPYVPPARPVPAPRTYQPAEAPAVVALLEEAESSRRSGNLDAAIATTERALRIEPRNPRLIHKLASLRLQQNNPRLAEDLARKSNALAGGDSALIRRNWQIIAEARRQLGDERGAEEAENRAGRY